MTTTDQTQVESTSLVNNAGICNKDIKHALNLETKISSLSTKEGSTIEDNRLGRKLSSEPEDNKVFKLIENETVKDKLKFDKFDKSTVHTLCNDIAYEIIQNLNNNGNQKTNNRIFTTTYVEKKKNQINFRVIKNREKELNNNHHHLNSFNLEKINKSGNDFHNDISTALNLNSNNNHTNNNNYCFNNIKSEESNNINTNYEMKSTENDISEQVAELYGQKIKLNVMKDSYLDILLNAAEKLFSQEMFLIESNFNNNYETKVNGYLSNNNSNIIDADIENDFYEKDQLSNSDNNNNYLNNNEEDHNSSFMNSNSNNLACSRTDNLLSNTTNKKILHDKCENKNCNHVSNKKKIILNKKKIAKGKFLWLCASCTRCWNSGQYCYYCLSIYGNSNNCTDGKDWIQCDSCSSWHHIHCEEKRGHYSALHKQLEDSNFKYFCPNCRQTEGKNLKTNELLKKKRNAQRNNNFNFYSKQYDYKYSKSNRIKEKFKNLNKAEEDSKKSKNSRKTSINCESETDELVSKLKKKI